MTQISRRSFVKALGTIPFAVWFSKNASAQASSLIRHDAFSTEGISMLRIYADAVGKIMDLAITPKGHPSSWEFQWYIHWITGDPSLSGANKSAVINNIYGASPASPSSEWKALASTVWDTCHSHGAGMDSNYFLPWHRMYVFFFERIIRKVSGHQEFTLPYWNYSTQTAGQHGVIPLQFRLPGDPVFRSLYRGPRNVHVSPNQVASVNAGEPIDKYRTNNPLGLNILKQCNYKPSFPIPGFCSGLDGTLHGSVHVLVGDPSNMGSVSTAAGDPIFWLHHCNIDRLWASWNRAGRLNPTADPSWMSKEFIFADENGVRVSATVKDFVDIVPLGYGYDSFEPVAPPDPTCDQTAASVPKRRATVRTGPVSLAASTRKVTLEPEPGISAAAVNIPNVVTALSDTRHLYLVLSDLRASAQPGVFYDVYIDVPPTGLSAGVRERHYAGTIHFFDAVGQHDGHSPTGSDMTGRSKFFSFEITGILKSLRTAGALKAKPSVSIVPAGRPRSEARPVIGEISLIER